MRQQCQSFQSLEPNPRFLMTAALSGRREKRLEARLWMLSLSFGQSAKNGPPLSVNRACLS
jgi:hypothetical protein